MSKISIHNKLQCLEAWVAFMQRGKNTKGNTKKQRNAKPKFQRRHKSN